MGDWTGTVSTFSAGEEVPASKLRTLADVATAETGAWTSTTLTPTTISFGDAVVVARYRRVGKTVDLRFQITMGSTTTYGGTFWMFTVPADLAAVDSAACGPAMIYDFGVNQRCATVYFNTTTDLIVAAASANVAGPATPFTWSQGDVLQFSITYEQA